MAALPVNALAYNLPRFLRAGQNAPMNKRHLATPLAALMRARGISDNQLARALGIPQPTISRIASGKTKEPKASTLRSIADYFGVRTDDLREFAVEVKTSAPGQRHRDQPLPTLAQDIARRWMSLSPDRQEWFRDLIFTMAFMEERFPAMRKGRPKGETYSALERAIVEDMHQLKLKFDQ